MRPSIVVIAYNRIDSMKRLLASVEAADYPVDESIRLVISIDRAKDNSNAEVFEAAEDFVWSHGEKQVIFREENYGLKKHVLTCGDYSSEYGSVILLEDDLYVSPAYYTYACAALAYTAENQRIGGVSLYNHRLNVHVREPFEAINDASDNWYFQFASSWGQAFTADQWGGFRAWLKENDGKDLVDVKMPANVSGWSDKSWLKYYIKYLIETDRYFLYPTVSYTTNFAEEGTHATAPVNDLQVPLSGRRPEGLEFKFTDLQDAGNVYDAFFENVVLKEVIAARIPELLQKLSAGTSQESSHRDLSGEAVAAQQVLIDLYGYKHATEDTKYILSSKSLPYRYLAGYARKLRPLEANVLENLEGEDFFLYDLSVPAPAPKISPVSKLLYNYRAIKTRSMIEIIKYRLRKKL